MPPPAGVTEECRSMATKLLLPVLSTIISTIEPFILGIELINFQRLPPFITFMVYKAAAIITNRILLSNDYSNGLRDLKICRLFLSILGERWLSCSEFA